MHSVLYHLPLVMNRNQLRKEMREQRRAVTPAEHLWAAYRLRANLKSVTAFRGAKRVGLYLQSDGEIDPALAMKWAWSVGKICYLPILSHWDDRPMSFGEVWPNTKFAPNKFGIPEPLSTRKELIKACKIDCLLMPLVAYDEQANRLGMGGGYYDRTLAFSLRHPYYRRPKLIGLAHHFQKVEQLPFASWDVPIDGIVTDLEVRRFIRNA